MSNNYGESMHEVRAATIRAAVYDFVATDLDDSMTRTNTQLIEEMCAVGWWIPCDGDEDEVDAALTRIREEYDAAR